MESAENSTNSSTTNDGLAEVRERIEKIQKLKGNEICADCRSGNPLWSSRLLIKEGGSLAVLVCDECAIHHHQELGSKRCIIKFLEFYHEWTSRELEILELSGNRTVKNIYEAKLSPFDYSYYYKYQSAETCLDPEEADRRQAKFVKHKYKKCEFRDDLALKLTLERMNLMAVKRSNATANRRTRRHSAEGIRDSKNTTAIRRSTSGSDLLVVPQPSTTESRDTTTSVAEASACDGKLNPSSPKKTPPKGILSSGFGLFGLPHKQETPTIKPKMSSMFPKKSKLPPPTRLMWNTRKGMSDRSMTSMSMASDISGTSRRSFSDLEDLYGTMIDTRVLEEDPKLQHHVDGKPKSIVKTKLHSSWSGGLNLFKPPIGTNIYNRPLPPTSSSKANFVFATARAAAPPLTRMSMIRKQFTPATTSERSVVSKGSTLSMASDISGTSHSGCTDLDLFGTIIDAIIMEEAANIEEVVDEQPERIKTTTTANPLANSEKLKNCDWGQPSQERLWESDPYMNYSRTEDSQSEDFLGEESKKFYPPDSEGAVTSSHAKGRWEKLLEEEQLDGETLTTDANSNESKRSRHKRRQSDPLMGCSSMDNNNEDGCGRPSGSQSRRKRQVHRRSARKDGKGKSTSSDVCIRRVSTDSEIRARKRSQSKVYHIDDGKAQGEAAASTRRSSQCRQRGRDERPERKRSSSGSQSRVLENRRASRKDRTGSRTKDGKEDCPHKSEFRKSQGDDPKATSGQRSTSRCNRHDRAGGHNKKEERSLSRSSRGESQSRSRSCRGGSGTETVPSLLGPSTKVTTQAA